MLCQRDLVLAREFPYVVPVDVSDLKAAHGWCLSRFGGDAYWRTDYMSAPNRKSKKNSFWTAFNGVFYFREATAAVVEFKISFG